MFIYIKRLQQVLPESATEVCSNWEVRHSTKNWERRGKNNLMVKVDHKWQTVTMPHLDFKKL